METKTAWYPEAWYKVEYCIEELKISFKAWKIDGLDLDNPKNSDVQNESSIIGNLTWDGKMTFKQEGDYSNEEYAEQTFFLMKEVFKFGEQNWLSTTDK